MRVKRIKGAVVILVNRPRQLLHTPLCYYRNTVVMTTDPPSLRALRLSLFRLLRFYLNGIIFKDYCLLKDFQGNEEDCVAFRNLVLSYNDEISA